MMRSALMCILILVTLAQSSGQDHYIIDVDLPARIVQDVVITDKLPSGLIYKNDSLKITGGGDFEEHMDGPNDGGQGLAITWSFGNVNNSANRDIEIDFQAVVADVPGNREGVTLRPNRASLQWRDAHGLHSSSDEAKPVEIVEPDLSTEDGMSPASCKTGDNISFKISIYHSSKSSSSAFDADLTQSLPSGLVYIPESMEILSGPAGAEDDSHPSALVWHFGSIDSSWTRSCPIVLRYNVTATGAGQHCMRSLIAWTSAEGSSPYERAYSSEGRACLNVEDRRQGLCISKTAPDQVCPGCILNYTIGYENSGEMVHSASITEVYDSNTTFLSADPLPDSGTNDLWTIGDIAQGRPGKIDVSVRVMPTAADGTELNNTALISSESFKGLATARTVVMSSRPVLEIDKMQSSDFIRPGDSVNYTISFANSGPGDALNVSVTDIVDGHLRTPLSTPEPTRIWSDGAGTHLMWGASVLNTSRMGPGQKGEIELWADMPPVPEHPDMDTIFNKYRIDSDNAEGKEGSLETFVIHSLFVRKNADRDACAPNELLNYTITYGNELAVEAKDAVVTDRLAGADYIYASPSPDVEAGTLTWTLGTLRPHTEGTIYLTVRVGERPQILFQDKQSIFGKGYAASSLRLHSSNEPHELVNRVEITAKYKGSRETDSSTSSVRLLQPPGADMESVVKGSGYYDSRQSIEYNRNSNLSLDNEIHARYSPVNISLGGGNPTITIDSLFEDRTRTVNRARNEALFENYRYMSLLDHEASFLLDENQTVFSSRSEFNGGQAQTGYQRHAPDFRRSMDISEGYYGSFNLLNRLDSYGSEAVYFRSASGRGFVSSDKRAADGGSSLKSYEHGSGMYDSVETVASDPSIHKYVNLRYAKENWSAGRPWGGPWDGPWGGLLTAFPGKWSEGMVAENYGLKSIISEQIGYADFIQKDAIMGSSSLAISGDFSGIGSLEASFWNKSGEEMALEETFVGRYRLDASLYLSGLARFLGPHLSITKKAVRLEAKTDTETVHFRINVTNDGNKTLAPVEIVDTLPENMKFINSSLRPIIDGRSISWWIVSLQPGDTRTIDLRAGLNGSPGDNYVRAEGHYRNEMVEAEASCGAIPRIVEGLPPTGSSCLGPCPLGANLDVGEGICNCGWNDDYYNLKQYAEAAFE